MDRFFGLDTPTTVDGAVHIATFYDPVSLAIAQEILNDAHLPYLKKERGAGGAVRILVGCQTFGTDLYVHPDCEKNARELLEPLFAESVGGDDTPVAKEEEDV